MELGIYTFVETRPTRHGQDGLARSAGAEPDGGGGARRPGGPGRVRHRRAPPAGVRRLGPGRRSSRRRPSAPKRIRLTSAVTVLSSDDPVRVFQEFATLDLLSGGRAEIMVGRGSFIESFPLFGYDLADYDELFEEHLSLLLKVRECGDDHLVGQAPAAIDGRGVYPRPVQDPLPIWVAVGGTPQSAVRAGALGLPMAIAIIGGLPERFKPLAELHRKAAEKAGHPLPRLSINSHGFIADTSQKAADLAFPALKYQMDRIGLERGWPPMTREQYDFSITLRGANFIGSPQQIVEKILFQHEIFGHDRFLLQLTVGPCRTGRCCGPSSSSGRKWRPRCGGP